MCEIDMSEIGIWRFYRIHLQTAPQPPCESAIQQQTLTRQWKRIHYPSTVRKGVMMAALFESHSYHHPRSDSHVHRLWWRFWNLRAMGSPRPTEP